ncbi:sporulation protein YjcZ [Mesorhizobium sp. M00.F.Ca.ET.186.01.1.1]|uniref:sporulation protein YjcZ n=1 Tax=Brevibacillus parabrevis TaxID=54914 RepID=UPI00113BE289|nr:sporulation protein YjcZ [Mesorhizobium sp. M00.F.Ca.ET.186.01.1.1]
MPVSGLCINPYVMDVSTRGLTHDKEDVHPMSSIFNGDLDDFTLVLILFILLVIIGCGCD